MYQEATALGREGVPTSKASATELDFEHKPHTYHAVIAIRHLFRGQVAVWWRFRLA